VEEVHFEMLRLWIKAPHKIALNARHTFALHEPMFCEMGVALSKEDFDLLDEAALIKSLQMWDLESDGVETNDDFEEEEEKDDDEEEAAQEELEQEEDA
jgi:hypothetical protein